MEYNLPPKVRFALYIITSIAGIAVTYLAATNQISGEAVAAFSAVTALVAGLAGANVQK